MEHEIAYFLVFLPNFPSPGTNQAH
jgi:hypothetical protein